MTRNRSKELTDMADTIERNIREIREVLRRPLEAEFAARGQLTGPQRSVMQAVFHSDGMSLRDLCNRVGLNHSTVSGIVDRLEARGMLERQVNLTDRRLSSIVVTREVRDYMEKKAPGVVAHPLVRALKRATEGERKTILRGLVALRRIIGINAADTARQGNPGKTASTK
jgi:DNA-binding MarR family transcriptional regulator